MKKVRTKVKILAATAAVTVMAATGHAYMTRAGEQANNDEEISKIQLNVEKEDRDTIKIYLSNFRELAKSMQLSVKIDGENVKFNDENIEWLVDKGEEKVIADYKIDSDKKGIDFFMVSDKPLNSDGGIIEICKIDVSKDQSLADKLLKDDDTSYRVVPNSDDGDSYSYVTYSTNKNISGNNIENADDTILNMNTKPVIKFKDVPSVVDGKIVIVKGTVFKISDYVTAEDADGNEINDIKYSGNVDNKKVGSYNIKCTVTDGNNESAELETTVIVEESAGDFAAPYIYVPDEPLKVAVGESFNPLEGVYAKDYQGRELDVKVDDKYDLNQIGVYTLTYSATDYRGVTVTKQRTLLVVDKNDSDLGEDDSDNISGQIPPELEGIVDDEQYIDGDGTVNSPLLTDVSTLSENDLLILLNKLDKFEVNKNNIKVEYDDKYKIIHLELIKKPSMFSLASLLRNSSSIYMSVRVEQSKTELIKILDAFLGQMGYVEGDNSDKPENPGGTEGDSGSSGGIGSSGGSSGSGTGNSSSSNDSSDSSNETVADDKEIPSQLQGILDNIEHVEGNGTSAAPLLVDVNSLSSTEFKSFLTKLDKFKISRNNIRIEYFKDYRIVHLELNEKNSLFNLARLFRSSESTYISIRIDNTNTELISVMDDFLAKMDYNESNNSSSSSVDGNTGSAGNSGSTNGGSGSENPNSAGNSGSSNVISDKNSNTNNSNSSYITNGSEHNVSANVQDGEDTVSDNSVNDDVEIVDDLESSISENLESESSDEDKNQDEIKNKSDEKHNSIDDDKNEGGLKKQSILHGKVLAALGVFAAAAGVIISVLHLNKKRRS